MSIKKITKLIGGVMLGVMLFSQNIHASAFGNVNVAALNIRAGASTDEKVIGTIRPNDYIHILNKADDGWYTIETKTDQLGYVSGQYIDIQKAKGVINANGVNVRSGPDYSAPVISRVYKNNIVYAYAQIGDWFLILNGDQEGYIHREFVDGLLIDQLPNKKAAAPKQTNVVQQTIATVTGTNNESSAKATDIVSYAKQFLGSPYVYGGNCLTSGVDCSGFTTQIFKKFGVSLSRSSAAQYANNGRHVDPSDVRAGDLMFYGYNGRVSHVAMYIGNGQVIQASTPKTGVITGTAFRTSGKPLIGIKRVL